MRMVHMRSVRKMMLAIMDDETTDCNHHEQMTVCIRFCISQLEINEVFGFYELEKQDTATLLKVVLDVLLGLQFEIKHSHEQCHDGTENVDGHLHGLQRKIRNLESRALFIYCAGHTINLVIQYAISVVSMFRDRLHIFGNLVNFVRDSPKRLHIIEHLQVARCQIVKDKLYTSPLSGLLFAIQNKLIHFL